MDCDEKRLLKRMVPHGFMAYLSMPLLSPAEEAQLDEIEHDSNEDNVRELRNDSALSDASSGTNTARLRSRIASLASASSKLAASRQYQENFRIFFHVLTRDHSLADLIWSQQTRRELRIALESELQAVSRAMEARGVNAIAWNHQQFAVAYPSLENEVRVGDIYMRLWLQAGDSFIRSWDDPVRLFELLFRRFLCELDRNPKVSLAL
jgi:DNAJ protein RME-8 N-terminal